MASKTYADRRKLRVGGALKQRIALQEKRAVKSQRERHILLGKRNRIMTQRFRVFAFFM